MSFGWLALAALFALVVVAVRIATTPERERDAEASVVDSQAQAVAEAADVAGQQASERFKARLEFQDRLKQLRNER